MRLPLTVLLLFAMLLVVSAAKAHVTRIPARCTSKPARLLCSTHFHAHRTNRIRLAARAPRIVYQWYSERHPAARVRVLALWIHRQARAKQLLRAYQQSQRSTGGLPAAWLRGALCVHHYEGSWTANTGNGYYGGFQFDLGTWTSEGGAGMPNQASPLDQLRIAYHTWQDRGWSPWPNTAAACGLL